MGNVKTTLDAIMQAEVDEGRAVGTVALAFHNNEEIYRGSFGFDDADKTKPMSDNLIFKMYSMTKPITAVAVWQLIEREMLSLEDTVDNYLPGFRNMTIINQDGTVKRAENKITIEMLLTMTAGLEYPNDFSLAGKKLGENVFWPLESGYPDKQMKTVELMNFCGESPLLYEPGTKWNYSICADVLGAIVEIVSGMKYSDYLKENIFEPLGMKDTDFYVPEDKYDRLVTMHDCQDGKYIPWDYPFLGTLSRKYKPEFESGGAGLCSTPDDYKKFALMLANEGTLPGKLSDSGEDVCILKPETVLELRKPRLTKSQQETANWYSLEGYNYGSLVRVLEDAEKAALNGPALGEFGWDGWAGTYVSIDPVNNIVFLYFINVTNGNREWQMKVLKNALYKELGLSK